MASEHERRLTEYEAQVDQLQEMIKGLEEEVVVLRRRLQDAPKRVRTLEERLLETKGQLAQAVSQNEKLSATLREAREHIAALREEVEKLTMPPSAYGTYLGTNDDGTVDIFTAGRKMRVALHPEIEGDELRRGQEVVLNESLNVVLARSADVAGEVVTFKELLEDGTRALVVGRADEERVCELADELQDVKIRAGDHLLMEGRSGLLLEKLPRPEVEELVLEEVPDVSYDDVGGLDEQIEMIKDAVELPYLYGDLFREHELQPPKGILLYGPPGCGKTLIAKAVANSLAKRVAERTGLRRPARTSSTSRARSSSTSTSARPSARSASSSSGRARRAKRATRSSCSSTRWTRCSAPAAPASPPTSSRRSCRSCSPRSTASSC